MEKTERITTVHASEVPHDEIHTLRTEIYARIEDGKIPADSPMVDTIFFILDTLEAGKGVTIFSRLAPEDYTLA